MFKFIAFAVSALAVHGQININDPMMVSQMPAAPKPKFCAAQNILDTCLATQGQMLSMCSYSDWDCKCQAQKSIVQCYLNCPDDGGKAGQDGQAIIFCDAARRTREGQQKNASSLSSSSASVQSHKALPTVVAKSKEETGNPAPPFRSVPFPPRKNSEAADKRKKAASATNNSAEMLENGGSATLPFSLALLVLALTASMLTN